MVFKSVFLINSNSYLSKNSPLYFFSLASKLHHYCKQNKSQNLFTWFLRLCVFWLLLTRHFLWWVGSLRWLFLVERSRDWKCPSTADRPGLPSDKHRLAVAQLLFSTKACAQHLQQWCSHCAYMHIPRFCWAKTFHVWWEMSPLRTCEWADLAWISNLDQVHDPLQGGVVMAAAPLKDYQFRGGILLTINSIYY